MLNRFTQSMSKCWHFLLVMTVTLGLNLYFILDDLYEKYNGHLVVTSFFLGLNSPQRVNSILVCTGFSIIGWLLFGFIKGIIIGLIIAGLILFAISQCPTGSLIYIYFLLFFVSTQIHVHAITDSTALGDAIMDNLGIRRNRTHFFNIFGSVYKLELPREDVSSIEQWEEHKQSEIFRNFLSFFLNDMKYKVTDMHVHLRRSNEPQNRIVEPLISSNYDANDGEHTEAVFEMNTTNTTESAQQTDDDDQRPLGSMNSSNKPINGPQRISMIFR